MANDAATYQTITPGCCTSHDHLDANMVMLAVWLAHRGKQLIARGAITDIGDDLDHVNAAWTIARERYMTASAKGERFDLMALHRRARDQPKSTIPLRPL